MHVNHSLSVLHPSPGDLGAPHCRRRGRRVRSPGRVGVGTAHCRGGHGLAPQRHPGERLLRGGQRPDLQLVLDRQHLDQ